jgi:hypothetical protein
MLVMLQAVVVLQINQRAFLLHAVVRRLKTQRAAGFIQCQLQLRQGIDGAKFIAIGPARVAQGAAVISLQMG